ncbi:PAS domain-containing protein [Streptomyces zagrosensis]|uniref:PAS domain-containing protein n=1 Tax=Streptomyces zagrosensis TaxID=1042984 RepID=A0A7W9QE73_9ACTN|nr:PAS domain-containing protein [Streptomyces zagrosensis]MBB5937387.1 PAS domain-containing protein [Streptomyces zagrosensis]
MTEGKDEGFSEELTDFRRRVEELRAVRALPEEERSGALDAALLELQHAAEVLWPRFEQWSAARGGGRNHSQEQRLLRALFQRMPVAVALVDREAVVRRMNFAATQLFDTRAGYATGRTLTGWFRHDGRVALRSQIAAVARGEGGRVLLVRVPRRPGAAEGGPGALWVTLGAIRPPDERQLAVLAVFQPADSDSAARGPGAVEFSLSATRSPATPDLAEVSRQAEVLDLVDDMATALLSVARQARPDTVARHAAQVLHQRFADWVTVDWAEHPSDGGTAQSPSTAGAPEDAAAGGTLHATAGSAAAEVAAGVLGDTASAGAAGLASHRLRRLVVCGPDGGTGLVPAVAEQDPVQCPLVVEAVRAGASALQVRPEEVEAFGHDASGAPVLVAADVTSLLCVPLRAAGSGPALGALTLFRVGARRAFEMAEAGVADRMARHLALALDRAPASAAGTNGSSGAATADLGGDSTSAVADTELGPGHAGDVEASAATRDICLTAPQRPPGPDPVHRPAY